MARQYEMRFIKNLERSVIRFKQYFQITFRYTGVYKNEEAVNQHILASLGSLTWKCIDNNLNIDSIGLEIKKSNQALHQVARKAGRYGYAIMDGSVLDKMLKLKQNHQKISPDIYENYQLAKYYANVVNKTVREVQEQINENAKKEDERIKSIMQRWLSENEVSLR